MLQIGYDIGTKSESFITGLQEIVLENDSLKEKEINRRKLNTLNQLQVTDWDCDSDSIVYVLVENIEQNKAIIISIGGTDSDLEEMGEDDNLDITTFAIERCKADFYVNGSGFGIE